MSAAAPARRLPLPASLNLRAAFGAGAFWLSSLAVGGGTFVVLAVLSGRLPGGGLAAVTAVLGLSFVLAVPPGALQLRATAAAGGAGADLAIFPPRLLLAGAALLAVISPLLAEALKIPTAAVALGALQLPLSCALGSVRGSFIGSRSLGRASASFSVDASFRLGAGVGLGLLWGATGVAAALVLATVAALVLVRPTDRERSATAGGSTLAFMLAFAVVTILTNVDVLLAPRVLGHRADAYSAASVPAKGIYFALFAVSWLAVSLTLHETRRRRLIAPVLGILLLGLLASAVLVLARPLLPAILHHGEPSVAVLGSLCVAMSAAGASAAAVSMAVARGGRWAWALALLAVVALAAYALSGSVDPVRLALGMLLAQLVALAGALVVLLRTQAAPQTMAATAVSTAPTRPAADAGTGSLPDRGPATPEPPAPKPVTPEPPLNPFPTLGMVLLCLLILVGCLGQAPGHILADTKLDLYVDPGRFLARSLHLWDPSSSFGQVQNQAVGYLFPMGAFFLAAKAIAVPMWIAQRVWLALLISLGTWGTARVARALRIGTPNGWLVGGLAYGVAPFVIGQLGSTSAGVIPAALAPWVLLPLIGAARAGSPRRSAARSGLAVLAMGGINATSTFGVLPLAVVYLLTRRPSRAQRRLGAWWVLSVILACAWWIAPLVYQGRYGLDFVRYTETSATTQSTTALLETVRGTSDWLAYLHLGSAWLPAGWALATESGAVLLTVAVACAGLAGLSRVRLPEARFLVISLAVGVVCVGAGYIGPGGGLAGHQVQTLLGGALAAFRNTEKFEPVVTLPIALGIVSLLAAAPSGRPRLVASVAMFAVVIAAAVPFWQGSIPTRGSFTRVPAYWTQLAGFMRTHATRSTTLLLPSSAFAEYRWGRPMDEPLEPLATTPWAVRSLLPLGGVGSTQMLDAIETEIVDGHVNPHLSAVLSRMGVSYVVARNDLAWQTTDSPAPDQVRAALRAGGLRPVASFGPQVPAEAGLAEAGLPARLRTLPALQVYRVAGAPSIVHDYPQAGATVLSGGPQSLVQIAGSSQLGSRAVILAASLPGHRLKPSDHWVVSDAAPRVGEDFGLAQSNLSYTLAAGASVAGDPTLQTVPAVPGARQAVAVYPGEIDRVSASSYGSWILQLPELAPAMAFDDDPSTAWTAGTVQSSRGQWVEASLRHPVSIDHISVRLLEDGPWRPVIRRLTVTTSRGSRTSTVQDDQLSQTVPVAPGPTSFVRVTLDQVGHQTRGGASAGLRTVSIPGVAPVTPDVAPAQAAWLLSGSRRLGITPTFDFTRETADPDDLLRSDPETELARSFTLPAAARLRFSGTVLPQPGARLDALLTRTRGLHVSASSSYGELPRFRPANAFDGSRATAWVAAPRSPLPDTSPSAPGRSATAGGEALPKVSSVPTVTDPDPRLSLHWRGMRRIAAVRVLPAAGFAAPPRSLLIRTPHAERLVRIGASTRLVHFPAVRTDRMTISFPDVAVRQTSSGPGARVQEPVGVSEIDFPALRSLQEIALPPSLPIHLACGRGPALRIDGRAEATSVSTTAGAIVALQAIPLHLCTPGAAVRLAAGGHRLISPAGGAFTLTDLTLQPPGGSAATAAARPLRIESWGADDRTLALGSGAATYLAVRQNFNRGWEATLDGHRLDPVELAGWEQGFAVPAGAAATLHLVYAPDHGFRLSLLIGALLVAGLILLALAPVIRRRPSDPLLCRAAAFSTRPAHLLLAAVAVVALALVCWPALIALPLLVLLARMRRYALPWVVAAALAAAGILVAVHVVPFPAEHAGAFGVPAEILTGVALAGVLAALLLRPRSSEPVP